MAPSDPPSICARTPRRCCVEVGRAQVLVQTAAKCTTSTNQRPKTFTTVIPALLGLELNPSKDNKVINKNK